MNVYEDPRGLLSAPYAVKADGTVLSAGDREQSWTGVKTVCGRLALRWDGRVLTDEEQGERAEAVAQWRGVREVACCGGIECALLAGGELVWLHRGIGQLRYGHRSDGWTDVTRLFVTADPCGSGNYADYAVGIREDGSARVAYLGGSTDRSRELEGQLKDIGPIDRLSEDCRVQSGDGRVWDLSTRGKNNPCTDPIPGYDRTADGCLLLEDGRVQVPPGQYPGAEQWRQILCVSGCFLPIETGRHLLMALRRDGRVLLAERYGHVPADTSEWKLFDHPDTFAWEREKTALACISEGESLDLRERLEWELEESLERIRRETLAAAALQQARETLARTRGPFSGKKREKLQREIARLEEELSRKEGS